MIQAILSEKYINVNIYRQVLLNAVASHLILIFQNQRGFPRTVKRVRMLKCEICGELIDDVENARELETGYPGYYIIAPTHESCAFDRSREVDSAGVNPYNPGILEWRRADLTLQRRMMARLAMDRRVCCYRRGTV